MINALLNGLLNAISKLMDILLYPINALLVNLFPSMSSAINTFNQFVNTYLGGSLSYFFSILPPVFRGLLVTWFTFLIGYYSIYYTYTGIIKLFHLIQKIKFW